MAVYTCIYLSLGKGEQIYGHIYIFLYSDDYSDEMAIECVTIEVKILVSLGSCRTPVSALPRPLDFRNFFGSATTFEVLIGLGGTVSAISAGFLDETGIVRDKRSLSGRFLIFEGTQA